MASLVRKTKAKTDIQDTPSKGVGRGVGLKAKLSNKAGQNARQKVRGSYSAKVFGAKKGKLVSKPVANEMLDILCKQYPEAACELVFASDFQLLTAVILSAQCTDNQVNKVTQVLFKRYPTALDLARASLEDVKEIIRPTGYFNAKAKNIKSCAQAIVECFSGVVPRTQEELVSLPGVGRKTANCVLGVVYGVPGWTVDTHVQRLSGRLGLTENTDPLKIEQDLQQLFAKKDWSQLSITLIWHGRRACYARNPDCQHCPISHLCPSSLL